MELTIAQLLEYQEDLEKKARYGFNDTSLPYSERQEYLADYQTARKLLHEIANANVKR